MWKHTSAHFLGSTSLRVKEAKKTVVSPKESMHDAHRHGVVPDINAQSLTHKVETKNVLQYFS